MRHLLLFLILVLMPLPVAAEAPPPTESLLARAIFRAKTGPRSDLRWRECTRVLRRAEAAQRAREYAGYLMDEYRADPEFDPWVAAAIMAQESSFNRCAISRSAWRALRTRFEEEFGRELTESDLRRILRYPRLRRRLEAPRFDAGLAQFRWPGTMASRAGLTDPAELIDAQRNTHLLAVSLAAYRQRCDTQSRFTGRHTFRRRDGRTRTIRYNIPCEDGYWVSHNTGGSWFNYRYYRSVNTWYERLVGFSESRTIEAYNEHG